MKSLNILSTIVARNNLGKELFNKYMSFYDTKIEETAGFKYEELDGVIALFKNFNVKSDAVSIYDNYYLGYSIPQIGKEFDILRFGTEYNINIEIKSDSSYEKILRQQQRNKYYLNFLEHKTYIYTYIQNENILYKYIVENDNMEETSFTDLYNVLIGQNTVNIQNIDELFEPTNYLVSPFNSTDSFIQGKYFLTEQQEDFFNNIQKKLLDNSTKFIALTGGAGTGKTLLTYHIARKNIELGKKVLILHCGPLNNGQNELISKMNWEISMTQKGYKNIEQYNIVIIDEAQRMHPDQFDYIKEKSLNINTKIIFSYDENQYLSDGEQNHKIKERIETELSCNPYKLTNKIRTNKEIASFIIQLFDNKKNIPNNNYPNIKLFYCKKLNVAQAVLNDLFRTGWKVPNYTPGTRSTFRYEKYRSNDTDSAHALIGQEFDKVAIVIDEYFFYDDSGKLKATPGYYSQNQMLYQIITRTRKKLYIIILNNDKIFSRCLEILNL